MYIKNPEKKHRISFYVIRFFFRNTHKKMWQDKIKQRESSQLYVEKKIRFFSFYLSILPLCYWKNVRKKNMKRTHQQQAARMESINGGKDRLCSTRYHHRQASDIFCAKWVFVTMMMSSQSRQKMILRKI
jgi:hypothetical protein